MALPKLQSLLLQDDWHGGIRTEYLGLYAAWVAFKASINGDNIAEKIRELEAICYKTNAVFRVKDRY